MISKLKALAICVDQEATILTSAVQEEERENLEKRESNSAGFLL